MMLLFWVLLLAIAAVALVSYTKKGSSFSSYFKPGKEDPIDTLKRRFAEGEISKDEYEERKEALQEDGMFKP